MTVPPIRHCGNSVARDTSLSMSMCLIISARYGPLELREPIPHYDKKMTAKRADELRPYVQAHLKTIIEVQQYQQVFINLGKTYRRTLDGFPLGDNSHDGGFWWDRTENPTDEGVAGADR